MCSTVDVEESLGSVCSTVDVEDSFYICVYVQL